MKHWVLRYCAAIAATIVATLLRILLAPVLGAGSPFLTYFLATLVVVWYAGFGPAILMILFSAAAGTYLFVSPATSSPFFFGTAVERVTILGFIFGSSAIAFLLGLQRKTLDRLKEEVVLRRAAENAERQQRLWFETTLASIGDAVIATDAAGTVIFMNPIGSDLTGWDIAQVKGQPLRYVFRIVNEQTGEEPDNPVDIVIRNGATVGLANHTLLISKDSRRIPIDDSGAPIKQDGQTVGAVLVFRDVTERRNAQRQIERSERRYRLLFQSNPQPMWVFDRETLAFLAVNEAAVRQYGYSEQEFLQMTVKDIRPTEEIPHLLETLNQPELALHRKRHWRHRKRDGTIISVEITANPIQFEGRGASLVLATDITERKLLEEQFYQAQRLESIGRLAGGVAHDFNNLLTVINGYAALILSDLTPGTLLARRVAEISAAGQQAAALTEQLLAFSRRQVIQPKVFNLNEVIAEIDSLLRRLIGEDIELVVTLASDLGHVSADVGQLQQIIMNLAVNARDAMPEGGSLLIETGNAFLDAEYCASHPEVRSGAYVMLGVTDTGSGMTPEVQKRIFEPFFTTKPVGSGTGLGLATVHGMVRQSNGWIWVYSEPGSGTTFKVYLPRTDEPLWRPQPKIQTDVRGNETVLVVEDQQEVRTLAVTVLERYGYRVLSAKTGEEAAKIADSYQGQIHLLLTDVVMPGMGGRALAKRLRADRPLRVLYMSGYTENAIAHSGILEEGLDYIQKPFTPEMLAEKVREILGRAQP